MPNKYGLLVVKNVEVRKNKKVYLKPEKEDLRSDRYINTENKGGNEKWEKLLWQRQQLL